MRKLLLVSLAASLLVGVAACGSSTPSSTALIAQLVLLRKVPASECAAICNKYLKTPPSGQYAPFTMTSMISGLNSTMPKASSSVTLTTFAGQPAYKLTEPDGTYVYIAERGKHYLLEVTAKKGELTFSQWNSVPAIVAPPASQVANYPGAG